MSRKNKSQSIDEVPHIEKNINIAGKSIEGMDLRIEDYPIPEDQKKKLEYEILWKDGVVAKSHDGKWIVINSDGTRQAKSADVSSHLKLPDDWEKYMKTEVAIPRLTKVFKAKRS